MMKNIENCQTIEEILSLMSKTAHECIACRINEKNDECDALLDKFRQDWAYIIPKIVDMKTMYWQYRHDNQVFDNWDKLHVDLCKISRDLENKLWELA